MTSDPTKSPRECIHTLAEFFSSVDTGDAFTSTDPSRYQAVRRDLRDAVSSLLVWGRPVLEVTRGIMWPYEAFAERRNLFLDLANGERGEFLKEQAELFLAFLPFPGQWSWMSRVEGELGDDPEVKEFLLEEDREILKKIYQKPQRHYKLRHFCQVLKRAGSGREKGVLRIFSLPYLFTQYGLPSRLGKRYVLFVEPPMGVVFRHLWWRHFRGLDDPCLMGVTGTEDVRFLKGQEGVEAVHLAHGDFLEDLDPISPPPEKAYDVVFNATFEDMRRKRHALLLELLRHPLLGNARALLIGRGSADNVENLRQQVVRSGLGSRVTVLANLRRSDVPALLSRCRMGVHLSLYENACRSIYEFLRADLPCVISSSMAGMNLEILNEQTGMAVTDAELPGAISHVLRKRSEYEPRRWFLTHSGSRNSSSKLNEILRNFFERRGYEWREDIVPLASSGASRYVDVSDHDRFRRDFEWILECFEEAAGHALTFSID